MCWFCLKSLVKFELELSKKCDLKECTIGSPPCICAELLQKSGKFEDIHCLQKGEKAEDAFAVVSQGYLEYFEKTTIAESQIIIAENLHFENRK